jgi:hypothetical protein
VQLQKNKKLDFETLLYQTQDGVIDTDLIVSPHEGPSVLDKDVSETIGVLELRTYITRQLGVEHDIHEEQAFDKVVNDFDNKSQLGTYKDVPPQFHMAFEKNCSTLDGSKGNREKKKVHAKRPGDRPWAIFRFHYRTKGESS